MISILAVPMVCVCGWRGPVIDCEADDDGDLLCPECALFVVELGTPAPDQPTGDA